MTSELSLQTITFADTFIDVADLNAHVSTKLGERIEEVTARATRGERTAAKAYAILGAAGGGKTHVFARLRHEAGLHATLVLLRPFFGVSLSPRDVLATTVDQLCLPVRGGPLTHLEVLAAHWLCDREGAGFPSAALEEYRALSPGDREARLDRAVGGVLRCIPEVEPAAHLARSLFSLVDRERSSRWSELAWLSGREPRQQDSAPLSEADVAHLMRIIAVVAAPVAPLVLTFDQLENLASDDDTRVLGYGNLVAELVDTIPSLTIAQLALTSEWMQYIEPRLTLPQKSRVAGEVLLLDAPDRAQRERLLRTWHAHLAPTNGRGGRKRFPSPLAPEELESLLDAPGITPRLLLTALSRAAAGRPIVPPSSSAPPSLRGGARYDGIWDEEYEKTLKELTDKGDAGIAVDAAELAEGVTSALSFFPSLALSSRNERDRVLTEVRSPAGMCTLLYATGTHHSSVGSALAKSIEIAQTGKSVFVREERLALPLTWEVVQERRVSFECLPNARWLSLEKAEVARFLTLARLSSRARANRLRATDSHETLTDGELRARVQERTRPQEWRPAAAIVSWLSDVPRERAPSAPCELPPAPPAPPAPPDASPPFAASTSRPPPPPTVNEWMRMGAAIGKATVLRYASKVRAFRGGRGDR